MYILITYDISDKHPEVKALMLDKGYRDRFLSNGKIYYLPNTSLLIRSNDTTPSLVRKQFELVVEEVNATIPLGEDNVTIQRCLAVEFSNCNGITGEEHSDI